MKKYICNFDEWYIYMKEYIVTYSYVGKNLLHSG